MKFYNAFGIKPTNSFTSAGTDYYIPNLDTPEKVVLAYKAFEKSYGKTNEYIRGIEQRFNIIISDKKSNIPVEQIPNLIHLFFAVYDPELEEYKNTSITMAIYYFINEFVIYDEANNKVGVKMHLNDTLFINSGIKVALDTVLSNKVAPRPSKAVNLFRMLGIGVAGLYVNKSGMGNRGFDTRAVLVDEDYSGYVHLSMAYTKDVLEDKQNIIYCGDKLTQMVLIPVFHDEYIDITEDEYNKIMSNSKRGDGGFGSTDIKH